MAPPHLPLRVRTSQEGETKLRLPYQQWALFIFFDPGLTVDGPLPSMNNQIVGATNTPLRDLLRKHREMSSGDDIALLHEAFESAIKNEAGPME